MDVRGRPVPNPSVHFSEGGRSRSGCPTTVFGTDLVMVSAVFNIPIFSVYFLYMPLHILYFIIVCERARWSAWRQSALQGARRGRQISDVTVSIHYRV